MKNLSAVKFKSRVLLITLALVSLAVPSVVFAFNEVSLHHTIITEEAMPWLGDNAYDDIHDQSMIMDTWYQFYSQGHNDSSNFRGSANNINIMLNSAVYYVKPTIMPTLGYHGRKDFFRILHVAQDFYAHSNWVESWKENLTSSELVEPDPNTWWYYPYSWKSKKFSVIFPESVPWAKIYENGGRYKFEKSGRIVKMYYYTTPYSRVFKGHCIVSGTGYTGETEAPYGAIFSHGDLNKDVTARPYYATAKDMAVKQTDVERRRFKILAIYRYGLTAWKNFVNTWLKT